MKWYRTHQGDRLINLNCISDIIKVSKPDRNRNITHPIIRFCYTSVANGDIDTYDEEFQTEEGRDIAFKDLEEKVSVVE
jgi:hypothetical protein